MSVVTVQRNFRRLCRKDAAPEKCIRNWHRQFQETGSVLKGHPPKMALSTFGWQFSAAENILFGVLTVSYRLQRVRCMMRTGDRNYMPTNCNMSNITNLATTPSANFVTVMLKQHRANSPARSFYKHTVL
jgi:hypothetical protein